MEDVFGHEQYGLPADGPISDDYHPGDEVLIADGVHDARTKVVAVDDPAGTVRVTAVTRPGGRLEDRLRRPAPEAGRSTRPGCLRRRLLPPQVRARTARPATTGAGSTRNMTSFTAAAAGGSW